MQWIFYIYLIGVAYFASLLLIEASVGGKGGLLDKLVKDPEIGDGLDHFGPAVFSGMVAFVWLAVVVGWPFAIALKWSIQDR